MTDFASRPAFAPRLPWRTIAVALLALALIVGAALAYVGSQQRHLPAPFGIARNGVVAYDQDGLLYTYDLETGTSRALTSVPDRWEAPWFSGDGTRLVMARELSPTKVEFGVMPATGGEVTTVTTEPVAALGTAEFSPDGRTLMVDANVDLVPSLVVMDLEAGTMRTLDIGVPAERPSFRPLDGGEILFASRVGDNTFDVYLANADGSDLRKLYASTDEAFVFDKPLFSPDGSQVAFSIWDDAARHAQVHVVNADGTGLRRVAPDDLANAADPVWSPDGRRLAVARWFDGGRTRIAFIDPRDGTITETDIDVTDGAAKEWAPDGTSLFVSPNDEQHKPLPQVLVDPVDGTYSMAPWTGRSYPSWQRLAP